MRTRTQALALMMGLAGSVHATLVVIPIDITGGTSSQTSHYPGFSVDGSEAIDGNLGNFSHTAVDDLAPSWSVDFGVDQTFNRVIVHNRDSCCGSRLSDLTVEAFDSLSSSVFQSGVVNPGNTMSSPAYINVDLPAATTARSLTISRTGNVGNSPVISLGEVQIETIIDQTLPLGTDLTLARLANMTVAQSSSHSAGPAGNGVDGNLGNFTHTVSTDAMPWWRVNMGEMMSLEQVFLFNRTNCCGERLRDITVRVLDGAGGEVFVSELLNPGNAEGFNGSSQGGLSLDLVALNGGVPINGQTVEISRTEDPTGGTDLTDARILALGEVQVIGGSLVPEPASLILLGLAGAGLTVRRRR